MRSFRFRQNIPKTLMYGLHSFILVLETTIFRLVGWSVVKFIREFMELPAAAWNWGLLTLPNRERVKVLEASGTRVEAGAG
jgi:hypothetical protein